jgi:hypothetical protein
VPTIHREGSRGPWFVTCTTGLEWAYLGKETQTFGGTMEYSPSVELSRQEAMTLIRIANEGDIGADNIDEGTVTRLQSLGLVEQRGISLGLTLRGMQSVVRLRRS